MTEHEGSQEGQENVDPQKRGDVDPEEGQHLEQPEPGHPVGETQPIGGVEERQHEHPEDIGGTKSDEQGQEDVTQSPGSPPDPENG